MMRRIIRTLVAILVLTSASGAGCTEETTTYYNRQFGYSVEMPVHWEVVEETWMDRENTVGFWSHPSWEGYAVVVEVTPGGKLSDSLRRQCLMPNGELRGHRHGRNGYIVESRLFLSALGVWDRWRVTYYIEHRDSLYDISFRGKDLREKVRVSIDGYGKVN